MNTLIGRIACTAAVLLFTTGAFAQSETLELRRLTPEELEWVDASTGISRAIIAGDNRTQGMYAYRVRFPEGSRVEPHFHPDDRIVTVISGTLQMGYGERFEEATMKALVAGSVWTEPGSQPHFVWARDREVVIQVIGIGPSSSTPVPSNP